MVQVYDFERGRDLCEVKKGMTGKGLLIEHDGFIDIERNKETFQSIHESLQDGNYWKVPSPFLVDAIFQKFGIKNANGRIYPERTLKREVDKYQEVIRDNRAYGVMEHPESSNIDSKFISHIIRELHWEGNTLVGKLELHLSPGYIKLGIISTYGDMAANLLLSGYKIGVSSRGAGTVQKVMGDLVVGDDFDLICWDIVSNPSTPNAYIFKNKEEMGRFVESSKEKYDGKFLMEKLKRAEDILKG